MCENLEEAMGLHTWSFLQVDPKESFFLSTTQESLCVGCEQLRTGGPHLRIQWVGLST